MLLLQCSIKNQKRKTQINMIETTPNPPENEPQSGGNELMGKTALTETVNLSDEAAKVERLKSAHGKLVDKAVAILDMLDGKEGVTDRKDRYDRGDLVQIDAAGFDNDPDRDGEVLGYVQIKKDRDGVVKLVSKLEGRNADGAMVNQVAEDHGDGMPFGSNPQLHAENSSMYVGGDQAQAMISEQLNIAEKRLTDSSVAV